MKFLTKSCEEGFDRIKQMKHAIKAWFNLLFGLAEILKIDPKIDVDI